VRGFSESIRAEFTRLGIDVLVVSPGTTETEFFDSVLENTTEPNWPKHRPVSAAAVAGETVRAIRAGRHEIIPYRWGRVLCWLNRLSPRLVDRLMARYV
jgi:short-subunit dehydrogenase